MFIANNNVLKQELLKLVLFLQSLSAVQLNTLWQFVQFEEDKEQKWNLGQIYQLLDKATPQQTEQMVTLHAQRMVDEDKEGERKKQLDALSLSLSAPLSLLHSTASMFQLYQLQDLLLTLSYVHFMKFFEIIPPGTQLHQLHLLQQLQQIFGHLQPDALHNLYHEIQEAGLCVFCVFVLFVCVCFVCLCLFIVVICIVSMCDVVCIVWLFVILLLMVWFGIHVVELVCIA
jgi:hypothetical protein